MLKKLQNKEFLRQQKDNHGRTVIDVAMQRGNQACLALLASYGFESSKVEESVADQVQTAEHERNPSDAINTDNSISLDDILALPDVSLAIAEIAQSLKSRGNDHFQRKEWQEAQEYYTKAISSNPKDATFYANRSACQVQLGNYEAALDDATLAVGLRPDWTKAHYRKAVALLALGRHHHGALAAYQGLELEPSNSELQKLLRTCVSDGRKAFRESQKNNEK
jgi:tetratricopeptide (TPR) repeat protein